jgi:cytidine deaminase
MAVCGAMNDEVSIGGGGSSSTSGRETLVWPCGICRQFMAEFNADMQVVSVLVPPSPPSSSDNDPLDSVEIKYESCRLSDLLPRAFTPKALLDGNQPNLNGSASQSR